jgi:hypothetical protein
MRRVELRGDGAPRWRCTGRNIVRLTGLIDDANIVPTAPRLAQPTQTMTVSQGQLRPVAAGARGGVAYEEAIHAPRAWTRSERFRGLPTCEQAPFLSGPSRTLRGTHRDGI